MKKMTNKQRCKNCIHNKVCMYCHDYDDMDGIEICGDYKSKKKRLNHGKTKPKGKPEFPV